MVFITIQHQGNDAPQLHHGVEQSIFLRTTKQKIEYGVRNFALLDDIAAIMDDDVGDE
jgi:hypothetical protein